MQSLFDSSSQPTPLPLTSPFTVKDEEEPAIRIIHLDCGAGGDCTVLFTKKQFVVIDGGKLTTGDRLEVLLRKLIADDIMPLAFIVSHFDTDHYLGLFQAVKKLCHDPGTLKTQYFKEIEVITPAKADVLNDENDWRDTIKKYDWMENSCTVTSKCRKLKEDTLRESDSLSPVTFKDPYNVTFENGLVLELKSENFSYWPSVCDQANYTSLQWILNDPTKKITKTTYYTGGDSESGPLAATIVKLDHHGSAVDGANQKTTSLKQALYWVIMGAGYGHGHPGLKLLSSARNPDLRIAMTQHHFIDAFSDNPAVLVGRAQPQWGDIGFSLYANTKIVANIREKLNILTSEKKHISFSKKVDCTLDESMNAYLQRTRIIKDCPTEAPVRRDSEKNTRTKVILCEYDGCKKEGFLVSIDDDSVPFFTCDAHKEEMKVLQENSRDEKNERKAPKNNKRERKTQKNNKRKSEVVEDYKKYDKGDDDDQVNQDEIKQQRFKKLFI